jgi:benzoyl-CoA-dihydrodiol lyase
MESPSFPRLRQTDFQTAPDRYRHWRLSCDGSLARLWLQVQQEEGLGEDYQLKLNSYDLAVDIELADAIQRIRFEHPEVRCLVIGSAIDRVFCSGANIYMLGRSNHPFKVNFCKFTNETRLGLEDLSRHSQVRSIAACNGTAAGGGYELAMACDEIYLVDDGNSAVSLPEVPLLAVLPGTGGLTRLVDKRKVRRDLADVFCTVAEGVKGQRAVDWGLVDGVFPRSSFQQRVTQRARELANASPAQAGWTGTILDRLDPELEPDAIRYRHVRLELDRPARTATLTVFAPPAGEPLDPEGMMGRGADLWALRAFRELDDALLHLRVDLPEISVVLVRTSGDLDSVLELDAALAEHREQPFVREVVLHMARVLRRFDLTAKSFFALIEPGSAFAGSLFELALASDRAYMLEDYAGTNAVALSALQAGALPMPHGFTRLDVRFLGVPGRAAELVSRAGEHLAAAAVMKHGLATMVLDDLDYEDETRLAIEERASLSPDALTGMEANLRFPGAENADSKIFGRLSAWQNWIFQRPNAVGPEGALTCYGKPSRPVYDYRRT